MQTIQRLLVLAGGLAGAAGVGLSAVAAHIGGGNVAIAASFLLAHAPALLAIGLLGREGLLLRSGGAILAAGLLVFCGDLLMRHFAGSALFPMAAPIGGTGMIVGWLVVAATAFAGRAQS